MRLGIDFGTTNSAVAFFDGSHLTAVEIDPANDPATVLPSLIYIDLEHQHYLGIEAMQEYAQRETGRPVKWQRRYIGEFEVMVGGPGSGPIVFMQDAYVFMDEAALGRLLQSVKTALRDGTYQGTQIFDRFYTLDELIMILLSGLKTRTEAKFNRPCDEAVFGRPVRFCQRDDHDRRAEEILYKAALWAGFKTIRFQPEPMGATYLHHVNSPQRQRVLVFDFGGGTLDFTVADVGGDEPPEVLATHGVLVGGDDLDREIMRHLLKYFGAGSKLGNVPFPYEILDLLLNWQTMPLVSRPEYNDILYDFRTKGSNQKAIHALDKLVNNKLGFELFKEIERVKKELSIKTSATLVYRHDPINIRETITRQMFEKMIVTQVNQVAEGVDETLVKARVMPDEIDVVLRTGGSSLIPIFIDLLSDRFGADKLMEIHPLISIVGGLGIIAHEGRGRQPEYAKRYVSEDEIDLLVRDIRAETGNLYEAYLFQIGVLCYTDQETTLIKMPVELSRLPAIRPTQMDNTSASETHLTFTLMEPSTIYIAFTATAIALPTWLREFELTDFTLSTIDPWYGSKLYKIYRRDFAPGVVTLGGTQAEGAVGKVNLHYLVIIQAIC